MTDCIRHRGPDAEGFYLNGRVGLGSRRLSIIDLSSGDMPIYNEDRSIIIVFNGEIYNFHHLRERLVAAGHGFYTNSDTETIVHGYEEWGTGVVERLNGMFAFALWDSKQQRLLLARDRTGIKPLYYAELDGTLVFGSELKTIVTYQGFERRINRAALDAYLTFEYVPTPLAIFEGVHKLPPGHLLVWQDGQCHMEEYWDLHLESSEESTARSERQHTEELRQALLEAVEMEMIADVPVGVLLSGGIDSSTVAAMMSRVAPGRVSSFSISMEDKSFDESNYAALVARHLGTQHRALLVTSQDLLNLVPDLGKIVDEPLADSSIIPTTLLSRFVREHVKVALGGDGGDELFAGYSTLQAHRLMAGFERVAPRFIRKGMLPWLAQRLPTSFDNISLDFKLKRFASGVDLPAALRHQKWLGSFTTQQKHTVLQPEYRRAEADTFAIVHEKLADCKADHLLNRVLYQDMKMYLEGDILPKVDRASMSASLEVRVPLLNSLMLDFAARLPHRYKLHGLTTKYLLRQAAADELPPEILKRGKKGFNIPVAKWIAGPLLEFTRDLLHPDRITREGIFNASAVETLLDEHLARKRDHRKLLWTLLTFEMWYNEWV